MYNLLYSDKALKETQTTKELQIMNWQPCYSADEGSQLLYGKFSCTWNVVLLHLHILLQ